MTMKRSLPPWTQIEWHGTNRVYVDWRMPIVPGITLVARRTGDTPGRDHAVRKGLKRQLRRVHRQNPQEAERQADILGVQLKHVLREPTR